MSYYQSLDRGAGPLPGGRIDLRPRSPRAAHVVGLAGWSGLRSARTVTVCSMTFAPELSRDLDRIDPHIVPPGSLVPVVMKLAMVGAA